MAAAVSPVRGAAQLLAANRDFYDRLWSDARLIEPQRFNTWPLVHELSGRARYCLEVAPGLRPRLPFENTQFLDVSTAAVKRLRERGVDATVGAINAMPFETGAFDLVCAFDIVEHVADDESAFAEIARVCNAGATLLLSVPLYASAWTAFDASVGHYRRYEPADLAAKLSRFGFTVERSAAYGMQVQSSWLLELGMWFLTHWHEQAMRWYNRVFMPIGLRRQEPLCFRDGLIRDADIDTILIVCRKSGG